MVNVLPTMTTKEAIFQQFDEKPEREISIFPI